MPISKLELTHYRNINSATYSFSPECNLIVGDNGVGKTSILESIYLLAYGRSFRSNLLSHLATHGLSSFVIRSIHQNMNVFGFQRNDDGTIRRLLNSKSTSLLNFASHYDPVLFIDSSSHRLFTNQSIYRRQLLDWGIYHINDAFGSTWNKYQNILKQRNTILKNNGLKRELEPWNTQLSEYGEKVNIMREEYISSLMKHFEDAIEALNIQALNIDLKYVKGWNESDSLMAAIEKNIGKDQMVGYTSVGPHKGRIEIEVKGYNCKLKLSEGQQKLTHYALRLSQCKFLKEKVDKNVLFLVDDLGAELDKSNQKIILNAYRKASCQLVITSLNEESYLKQSDTTVLRMNDN